MRSDHAFSQLLKLERHWLKILFTSTLTFKLSVTSHYDEFYLCKSFRWYFWLIRFLILLKAWAQTNYLSVSMHAKVVMKIYPNKKIPHIKLSNIDISKNVNIGFNFIVYRRSKINSESTNLDHDHNEVLSEKSKCF